MNNKHTPGPWVWVSDSAGPEDEYGCSTAGPINPHTFKSSGFWNNPQLYGPGDSCVLTAGGGEYTPYRNPADARLIAAAPDMLAALRDAHAFLDALLEMQPDAAVDALTNNGESVADMLGNAIAKAAGR